jgi:L-threonylcarbamoyladenylate synthase
VRRIFEAKNRPMDDPLIAHICELEWLEAIARNLPEKSTGDT